MSALADAAGKFAEKIAELLDVFDFSFFVAGSAALGAFIVGLRQADVAVPSLSTELALIAIVASYTLGLICYALGRAMRAAPKKAIRFVRKKWKSESPPKPHPLKEFYDSHRLGDAADYAKYAKPPGRWSELYSRLWVLIRSESELKESYVLVRRYWILGAAYDGLGVAALLWILPVLGLQSVPEDPAIAAADASWVLRLTLIGLLIAAAMLCWLQANRYHRYQVDEVAATAAHFHHAAPSKGDPDRPSPPQEDGLGVDDEHSLG